MPMLGLYVHIPFCLKRCHYCDFVITTERSHQRFADALEQEIRQAAAVAGPQAFDTLYFGGGTPSQLTEAEFTRLFKQLRSAFVIKPKAEITCELNPDDSTPEKLQLYKQLGVNRISVGAQSFNDTLLKRMGRAHDSAAVYSALDQLRAAGFANISADLILKLPGQTLQDVSHSVNELIRLGASQLVLYDLDVHEKTVFGLQRRQNRLTLPPDTLHEAMFARAQSLLVQAGYRQYEVSSFARSGSESRHNLIYWKNFSFLGLGPGAFSYIDGVRSRLASDVRRYLDKCERGDWVPDEAETIGEKDRQIETLLTGLRLSDGIAPGDFPALESALAETIPPLAEQGLLEYTDGKVRLTARGTFTAESIIQHLVTHSMSA